MPQMLEALLDLAIDSVGAGRGFLVLSEGGDFRPEVARNFKKLNLEDDEQQFSRSVIQQVLQTNLGVLTDDAGEDPRFSSALSIQAFGLHSIICVPLSIQGQVRGAVYLDNRFQEGAFKEEDLEFLNALASQAAMVIFSTGVVEEQRRVRDLLGRYVSPDVAEELLKRPDLTMEARRQDVSVMFSDIRGFSSLAESSDPIKLLELLNRYYEEMVEVIFRHRGTLVTFLGDGVMVAFGAPLASADHAERAIAAGQELQSVAEKFRKNGVPLKVGIGICSGEAVVGDVGALRRREFAVIGHTTNVAARVEKLTGELKLPVLFTESTWERNGRKGQLVGEHRLKGMDHPVRIYQPEG